MLAAAAVLLLLTSAIAGWLLHEHTEEMQHHVAVTSDIADANIRTIGQVQRELLRLGALLSGGVEDDASLERHRAFVTQRMREVSLPYQLQALGSRELLDEAAELADRWVEDLEPDVRLLVARPGPATALLRSELVEELRILELAFNDLVARGEINRKARASGANDSAIRMLDSTRDLLLWLVASITGFLLVGWTAMRGWRRLSDENEAAATDLRRANQELLTLSKVARATDNLVVISDADGRIEWVNDAFERITGWTAGEARGRTPGELLQGPDTDPAVVAHMAACLARGDGFDVEVLNYSRTGRAYWVAVEVQPVHDDAGSLTHFIAVERDITSEKEDAQALRRARDLAEETANEKSNFLATMSHEIRTPLNAVLGVTGMLLETELSTEQRALVELARTRGSLLLELVNNTLSFSALEAGQVELERRPVHLRSLGDDVVQLFEQDARDRGLSLDVRLDAALPPAVLGDVTRLRQVLVNLVGNALKFTPSGQVHVVMQHEGHATEGVRLRIEVVDTGIGIPADRCDRLFTPFTQVDASTTREYGGSGLGLAICDHIVRAMGGRLDVTSTEGVGTRIGFSVELPSCEETMAEADDATPRDAATTAGPLDVLLAEDDHVNQIVAVHMLERLGHRVTVVGDGQQALERLGQQPFDVVFMDVHMPTLDGIGATREIHSRFGDARPPIIAMTANALAGDRERFLAAGMDDYVSKPVGMDALRGALDRVTSAVAPTPDVEATATDDANAPIDRAAFLALHGEEARDLLGRLVDVFLDSSAPVLDDLRAAVATGDADGVRRGAHRLRGSAVSICAPRAAAPATALEELGRLGTLDGASTALDQLLEAVEEIRQWRCATASLD